MLEGIRPAAGGILPSNRSAIIDLILKIIVDRVNSFFRKKKIVNFFLRL